YRMRKALLKRTPHGAFLKRMGYGIDEKGKLVIPGTETIAKNYNALLDELIRKGVVTEKDVFRPVMLFRDAKGELQSIPIGGKVPKGWKVVSQDPGGEAFLDLLEQGKMPFGASDFLSVMFVDHDVVHFAGFASNPKIMKQIRNNIGLWRAQIARGGPDADHLDERMAHLLEFGYFVPRRFRGKIRGWAPNVFDAVTEPKSPDFFRDRLLSLSPQEQRAIAQRVNKEYPGISRNFGGVTGDELALGPDTGFVRADVNLLERRLDISALSRALAEAWNGSFIDPDTIVQAYGNIDSGPGQVLKQVVCHSEISKKAKIHFYCD
ncbi:MAG: hypothetical protein AAF203_09610, partial [Pseudomonadota bacterium]